MKSLTYAAVFAAALGAAPAHATLQIAFSNSGGGSFFCADQTACDLDGAAKNLLLLNTFVGNIKIEGTFAASATNPDQLSVSNLTITNLGKSTETLTMALGDAGFSGPVSSIRSSASLTFNNGVGSLGALSFFADPLDGQPAATPTDLPGVDLFSTSGLVTTDPDSFAGTKDTAFASLGAFSMAEAASLTLAPGASITGFNESMAAGAVPEPSTWALLITGFGLMGFMGWRSRKSQRLAV